MGKAKPGWLIVGLLCSSAALAAKWDIEPSISIAGTYTDNLELDVDGAKVDEFVTEILPAIEVGVIGKRFAMDFEYKLQGLLYSRREDLDDTLSYAQASGDVKLIGDALLVSFSGALNQQIVDPGGRIGVSAISPGNRSEVGTFSVNPVWRKQLGSSAKIMLGYQYGITRYGKTNGVAAASLRMIDSDRSGVIASISGAAPRSSWAWRIDARDSTIDYATTMVDLRRVGGELAWSLSGDTAIFVGGGDEANEYKTFFGTQKIGGKFWHLGLRGRLDRRTTYSISAGEQHFGDSYEFSLKRTAGQLTTDIIYLEETTTIGQQQQGYDALFEFLGISGLDLPTPSADVYVRKRLTATSTLKRSQTRWQLKAFSEDRNYLTQFGGSDAVIGASLSWKLTRSSRTDFGIETGWERFDLRTDIERPENLRVVMRFRHELKNGVFFNARAWRNSRSATIPAREYVENAVSLGVGKRF